jgi:hypothetical protein
LRVGSTVVLISGGKFSFGLLAVSGRKEEEKKEAFYSNRHLKCCSFQPFSDHALS